MTLSKNNNRTLAITAGVNYLIIFFAAIYANFFVLEAIIANPVATVVDHGMSVRFGILAFLITAVCDIIVAWALYELYKKHALVWLSTYFRIAHAIIMGVAVFALPFALKATTDAGVLGYVDIFNTIWLIGLFFFGVHLIVLAKIVGRIKVIPYFLVWAGVMYMIDTGAHFLMPNYESYAGIFLALVAIPSIIGEMSLTVWLLWKGGR